MHVWSGDEPVAVLHEYFTEIGELGFVPLRLLDEIGCRDWSSTGASDSTAVPREN